VAKVPVTKIQPIEFEVYEITWSINGGSTTRSHWGEPPAARRYGGATLRTGKERRPGRFR
jgi:hypothetical protein